MAKFWIPEQFRTLTIAVLGPIATETRRHPFSIPAAPFICNGQKELVVFGHSGISVIAVFPSTLELHLTNFSHGTAFSVTVPLIFSHGTAKSVSSPVIAVLVRS
jgi:hypothetical protein